MSSTSAIIAALMKSEQFLNEYEKFNASAGPATDALVMEYTRKRNGFERSNATSRKTGALDIAKLPQYKVNDDIFKQKVVKAKGKNHSFDILIDWSGSFSEEISFSIRQAIIFADFAHKIKAPFRIVAFRDAINYNTNDNWAETHALTVLLSSQMKGKYETARKFAFLLSLIHDRKMSMVFGRINYSMYDIPEALRYSNFLVHDVFDVYKKLAEKYGLCGTPLNSALIEMRKLMRNEAKPGLIQNLIIITDGMSERIHTIGHNFGVIEDPISRKAYSWSNEDKKKFPFEYRQEAICQTHLILKTFDWGHINKVMFFIESSNFGAKLSAYTGLTTSGYNLAAVRKHYGVNAPLDVAGFGYIDHCIFVDRSTYEPSKSTVEINGKESAKKIATQFSKGSTNVRNLQLISRRIADLVCSDFSGKEMVTPGVNVVSWAQVESNNFDKSELDMFLEESILADQDED